MSAAPATAPPQPAPVRHNPSLQLHNGGPLCHATSESTYLSSGSCLRLRPCPRPKPGSVPWTVKSIHPAVVDPDTPPPATPLQSCQVRVPDPRPPAKPMPGRAACPACAFALTCAPPAPSLRLRPACSLTAPAPRLRPHLRTTPKVPDPRSQSGYQTRARQSARPPASQAAHARARGLPRSCTSRPQ